MTGAPEAPAVHSATAATEDQTAESAAPAAEAANASVAETEASNEPEQEPEHVQGKARIAASKTKATPAKPVASEAQQSAEQPSGRRERKQTSFFQPEKKIETEKLEIREVSIQPCVSSLSLICYSRASCISLTGKQMYIPSSFQHAEHCSLPALLQYNLMQHVFIHCRAKAPNLERFQMVRAMLT